jgi:hypothetical protein
LTVLQDFDFDDIDWDDRWDTSLDRQREEDWFNDDDGEDEVSMDMDRSGTPDY